MAWIETSEIDGRLHVQAYVKSPKVAELEYDLISAKSGRSGTSLTKQAGKVNAEAGQTYPLTKLRLGLAKEDTYRLTLNVYEKGKLIAEDTVVFP
ncbi:MAG: curli-like amyloid fiber formation chaperone CsgH [Gammaproteobacteria bacterium]|nr:curli-like amyloid fiber formation chaperone CsgH [Gammaproteobacteria bacterium]